MTQTPEIETETVPFVCALFKFCILFLPCVALLVFAYEVGSSFYGTALDFSKLYAWLCFGAAFLFEMGLAIIGIIVVFRLSRARKLH